jgi:hypothetical protein
MDYMRELVQQVTWTTFSYNGVWRSYRSSNGTSTTLQS